MKVEEIIKTISPYDSSTYHCYDTLRMILKTNKAFNEMVIQGINEGKITGFGNDLWDKIAQQNIRSSYINNFLEVLRDGYNQGYCTVTSKQISYSLDNCFICGGTFPLLIGTANCPTGSHTWIEKDNFIYDTTLMLCIDKSLKNKFGYIEENKCNPNDDSIYLASKCFTNDKNIKKRVYK